MLTLPSGVDSQDQSYVSLPQLGKILIRIAGNLMDADPGVLRQSQIIDKSCKK